MTNKKLIEVALPLEAINAASAREKSIRHGHPSTLHLWWARRPLAAARAVIWSSLVDDPSSHPELFPTEEEQNAERQRLFRILEQLVVWENSNNEGVLDAAKAEILKYTGGNPPALLDPFAGGGAIPLEAQRLGLEAHAHDLNPVAVMINKAMIEIPPKFAGQAPVNPETQKQLGKNRSYFYIWMRQSLRSTYPDLFNTMLVPKAEELVATPYRFNGSSEKAKLFFENGMLSAFKKIYTYAEDAIPVTVYYAYKQSETENDKTSSTGWETMLSSVIKAGFTITGTWPMRTERAARTIGLGTNALASSIVLVCRKRPDDAPKTTRRNLIGALRHELRPALEKLQESNIAPR